VERDHEVHFCFPSLNPEIHGADYEGIHLHPFRLPLGLDYHKIFGVSGDTFLLKLRHKVLGNLEWFFYQIWGVLYGFKIGRKMKPDIVYAETEKAAFIGYLLSKCLNAKFIVRSYAGTGDYYKSDSIIWRIKNIRNIGAYWLPADRFIIARDGTNMNLMAERLGVPSGRIAHWRNGVDFDIYNPDGDIRRKVRARFGLNEDVKIILSIARLHGIKRVDRLIFALPEVFAHESKSVCIVVGDGRQRQYLQDYCKERQIDKRVIFTGLIDHQSVMDILNAADIFVALADYSNCGNNLWEAMACGKCIVTLNNCQEITQILQPNVNAVLLPEDKLAKLPEVLLELISDDERRMKIEHKAREAALNSLETWQQRADREVGLLESLIN